MGVGFLVPSERSEVRLDTPLRLPAHPQWVRVFSSDQFCTLHSFSFGTFPPSLLFSMQLGSTQFILSAASERLRLLRRREFGVRRLCQSATQLYEYWEYWESGPVVHSGPEFTSPDRQTAATLMLSCIIETNVT
ncbi:uncharacterized [Tachysurus ichikawai]